MSVPELARYFEARYAARETRRQALLNGLTERERALVREAAVMGYVRGAMARGADIPPDSWVVSLVIDCCLDMPDLYPAFRSADNEYSVKLDEDSE